MPKGQEKSMDKAIQEAEENNRDFVGLYNRNDWPHWLDDDKNCQNTRHELLISTSMNKVDFKTDKGGCNLEAGLWYDPYSGETFTTSTELDLDHIVPLKFAHD